MTSQGGMQSNQIGLVCTQGAFWGLMVGLVVGVCRMVLEFAFPPPRCGVVDSAPAVLRSVHYLHFAILLCALSAIVVGVVSLLTPPPTHDQVCTQKQSCIVSLCKYFIYLQCYLLNML